MEDNEEIREMLENSFEQAKGNKDAKMALKLFLRDMARAMVSTMEEGLSKDVKQIFVDSDTLIEDLSRLMDYTAQTTGDDIERLFGELDLELIRNTIKQTTLVVRSAVATIKTKEEN